MGGLQTKYADEIFKLERYRHAIPIELMNQFDAVSKALRKVVLKEGENYSLDILERPETKKVVADLKRDTRFKDKPIECSDGTDIVSFLKDVKAKALKVSKISNIDIDIQNVRRANVYTFVPLVRQALEDIVVSMLKNTKSDKIKIASYYTDKHSGSYVIEVSDECDDVTVINKQSGIQFTNGKLNRAKKKLYAVCGYWLSARFSDGPYCVDMLKDNILKCNLNDTVGVVHHLVFPTHEKRTPTHPNEFYEQIEKGNPDHVAAQISTQRVKILVLDNNVARLRQSELSIKEYPNTEVDARTEINERSFKDGGFAMAFVHENNVESEKIYRRWEPHRFPIVFFSGGYKKKLVETEPGRYWHCGAEYLIDNMKNALAEVLENARLS